MLREEASPEPAVLSAKRTLAIIFGASSWPHYPDFHTAPSFGHSAEEIARYICEADGLGLLNENVLRLIDKDESASDLIVAMHEFLRKRRGELKKAGTPASDLIIYYVGHGGFDSRSEFFLALRRTSSHDPRGTSITAESLGRLITESAERIRTYLVLDCCFAATVAKTFMGGGALQVAGQRLDDVLPSRGDRSNPIPEYGVGLLCASGSKVPAKAPPNLRFTMFTGGVLEVLRKGDPDAPASLSLDDVQRLVLSRLREKFEDEAVVPEIHVPQQRMGRIDLVPLFPNPARRSQAKEVPLATQPPPIERTRQPQNTATISTASGAAAPADRAFAEGRSLERVGRYAEAALAYKLAAEKGHAKAQNALGVLYEKGRGVRQSETEAARLYRLATEQGHSGAQNNLGYLYLTGRGVQQSYADASHFFRLAAGQGNASAQTSLGYLSETGKGVPQSYVEAARFYGLAAEQGEPYGQYYLAQLFARGLGMQQSFTEAARLYRAAAEQGNASAQYALGCLYENGRGVRRSAADAMTWYRRAARQQHVEAESALRGLGEHTDVIRAPGQERPDRP